MTMTYRIITKRSLKKSFELAMAAMEAIPEKHNRKRFEAFCSTYLAELKKRSRRREFADDELVGRRAVYFRNYNYGTRNYPYVVYSPLSVNDRLAGMLDKKFLETGQTILKATDKSITFSGYRYDYCWCNDLFIVYR